MERSNININENFNIFVKEENDRSYKSLKISNDIAYFNLIELIEKKFKKKVKTINLEIKTNEETILVSIENDEDIQNISPNSKLIVTFST